MKVATFAQTGEKAGEMELPEKIFGVKLSPDLVHQVMLVQQQNRRAVSAHSKGKRDVSGGGKKPWAQKHTGRARHGSIRSPIWVGGGIAHGPKIERNLKRKISRTMRRKALYMVLSEKAKRDLVVLLEELTLGVGKTKALAKILEKLPSKRENTLIVLPEMNRELIRAGNNLSFAKTMQARELNVWDLLQAKYLVMPKESVQVIEKTFAK